MNESSEAPDPFIKAFSFTLKQFRLYSEDHPITREHLKSLASEITACFSARDRLTLGAMQGRLLVDGNAAEEKRNIAHDIAKDFERLGIDGVTFEKGIDLAEVACLLRLMSMHPKELQEKGGFKKAFEEKGLAHVKLASGTFQLVEEDQIVTDGGVLGLGEEKTDPGKKVRSIEELVQALGNSGDSEVRFEGEAISLSPEELVGQIEKNPGDVAAAVVQDVRDGAHLEERIRKILYRLIDGLIPFLVQKGKDVTKAIERISKEMLKAVNRLEDDEKFAQVRGRIPGIFEESTDDLRIRMVVHAYRENKGDTKALQKIAGKLLRDDEVRGRLRSSVSDDLAQAGMSDEAIRELFEALEKKARRKKNRITVDAEELKELRRKAALFDQGSGGDLQKDIQKLEIANKIIRGQKERIESVIHNLAEGLLIVDDHGRVVLMNPAAERMLGVKQSEKVGRPLAEGLRDEQIVSITRGQLRDNAGTVSKQVEVVSGSEETRRILKASTAVVQNEDGQAVGMVSVLSDVTKQRELSELKTKFVANVSHELRTPLVATQKSLALILDREVGEITDDQKKFLTIARRNIERLSRLINDLLDISKLEAGKMPVKPVSFSMRALIEYAISTVETWAADKRIEIKTRFGDGQLALEGDPDRLTQVMMNLIGNAIKYTPEGGTITVEGHTGIYDESITKGGCLEIAVCDTGMGIAPGDCEKIFDKFVQIGLTQPAGVSSTGLGLTIAKEIVELHSGRIWAESEEGKGSRFVFRLPLKFQLHEETKTRF